MSGKDIGIVALVVVAVLVLLPLLGGIGMMGGWHATGPGMMGGQWSADRWGGGWPMPFFGIIFWLLILAGIVLVVVSLVRKGAPSEPSRTTEAPLDILKRRLASGEITREEYEAVKKELT